MEALIAGVYLDGGMDAARRVVLDHWRDTIDDKAETPGRRDYKTRLQERLASIGLRPEYVMTETGPDHARTFRAEVHVDGRCIGSGVGASKKKAQQGAAREALASQALPNERNA